MRLKLIAPMARALPQVLLQSLQLRAVEGAPAAGSAFAGAYAPSAEYTPPTDPAVPGKLVEWQDWKVGLLNSWQASTQWGIDSWPLCPERYDWNRRRDWVTGTDSPFAAADRAYKSAYEGLMQTFNPLGGNLGSPCHHPLGLRADVATSRAPPLGEQAAALA